LRIAKNFQLILIAAVVIGGVTGYYFPQAAAWLKPFGTLFLNLILTAVIPLIFFSVSAAITRSGSVTKLGKIFLSMILVFLFTSIIASVYALVIVKLFPPAYGVVMSFTMPQRTSGVQLFNQIVGMFTVNDFRDLLTQNHMLALIVFSILVGFAGNIAKENGKAFVSILQSGDIVFMRVFDIIMYYAPIGFFAYFAALISEMGPKLITSYVRIALLYFIAAAIYFIVVYTVFAYVAGKMHGVRLFWKHIWLPGTTAIATCSSAASIPANLEATRDIGIKPQIYETVIPLGSMLHKDGSIIGGIFKIAFLFGIFHLDFTGTSVMLTAIGVSLLVGTVMGAIPSGGMLGELLILSVYGFPSTTLITIAAISIIIDAPATLLNVTGNTVCAMLTQKLSYSNDKKAS
jgi:Na+/H+-dicarboxylate symporter